MTKRKIIKKSLSLKKVNKIKINEKSLSLPNLGSTCFINAALIFFLNSIDHELYSILRMHLKGRTILQNIIHLYEKLIINPHRKNYKKIHKIYLSLIKKLVKEKLIENFLDDLEVQENDSIVFLDSLLNNISELIDDKINKDQLVCSNRKLTISLTDEEKSKISINKEKNYKFNEILTQKCDKIIDYFDKKNEDFNSFKRNYYGNFISIMMCNNCSLISCYLEEFNLIFLNLPIKYNNTDNFQIDILLEEYFFPMEIVGELECEKCKFTAIDKVFKFIYKFPKNLLFCINDYKRVLEEIDFCLNFSSIKTCSLDKFSFKKKFQKDKQDYKFQINSTINYVEKKNINFGHFISFNTEFNSNFARKFDNEQIEITNQIEMFKNTILFSFPRRKYNED